jgi:hypothetical protein
MGRQDGLSLKNASVLILAQSFKSLLCKQNTNSIKLNQALSILPYKGSVTWMGMVP